MVIRDEKFYTWDELVEKFPDKWVIVEEAEQRRSDFIEKIFSFSVLQNK